MADSPSDITAQLKSQIEAFETSLTIAEVGEVLELGDGIARASGLANVRASELVEFDSGVLGIAFNLEVDQVGIIVMGDYTEIEEGERVRATGRIASVPVGEALIGRVVNPLGQPIDGKGPIQTDRSRPIERIAPGVIERQNVDTPVQTGIKAIDSMIPIGRGQRELIIGDRQTGKTAIALDTIVNQRGQDLICIYVAIGQKKAEIARVVATLEQYDAMEHTIVMVASAADPAALQYIAPYAGCAMGEEFMEAGQDALMVYDDLTKHAWAYRQVSLLLRRPPGREAYPGDIFSLHSRLLERAARLSEIYLESDLFYAGQRPAVNVGLSVSRVGGDAQRKAMKQVAGRLHMDLAQYRSLAAFAQFGSDLDKATRDQLERGRRLSELLKQPQFQPVSLENQVMSIYAGTHSLLDDIPTERVRQWEEQFTRFMETHHPEVGHEIATTFVLSEENEARLSDAIKEFNAGWK
jgi:F-type H+-transporting ATPase subunit alpha